jgi:cytosine deaminase
MAARHILTRARLPEGGDLVDIEIAGGKIAAITQAGASPTDVPRTDLAGGMVWPGFVDAHTHLDKGHIWPRAENPDGSFAGALAATGADRQANWTAEDVARRFSFGLRCAYAHGTVAIRTHLDSLPPQHRITWPVFARLRAEWAGRIALQAVAIIGLPALDDPAIANDVAACVAEHGGIMGAVIYPMERLRERIEDLLRLCLRHNLALDVHIDETLDPAARSLSVLAEAALRVGFPTPIVAGHCCSLAVQDEDEIARTLDLMHQARLQVVSLPMCNLYLQDRAPGRTPRRRGVTLLQEFAARGIPVAIASDNCRDPFYAYGDHDVLEVFREAVRIAQLDRPFGTWHRSVTSTPADIMGLPAGRIEPGTVADLILFRARTMNELLARPQTDRVVLRAGISIDTRPPDYAELDDLCA